MELLDTRLKDLLDSEDVGLLREANKMIVNTIKERRNLECMKTIGTFRVGELVQWYDKKTQKQGKIAKIGNKFIYVDTGYIRWKIPSNMLKKVTANT